MRIGFDAKRAFKNNTGLGNYSRMIICALAQYYPDIEMVLFTPDVKGRYAHFFEDIVSSKSQKRAVITVVTPAGMWRLFPGLWRTFGIAGEIRRRELDVYHGLSHELPRGRVGDTRLVVSMHDLIVWRYPKHFPFVDRLIYKLKQRHACRRADMIVAISKQTERDLVDLMGVDSNKIQVVYQSCDEIFRMPISDERRDAVRQQYSLPDKYFLCVGTIEQRKNQAAVVQAFALLINQEKNNQSASCAKRTSNIEHHLVFVGRKTAYYDTVAEAVREYGLESCVHFLEGVDFADFPVLYSEADASVYMSIFEGFGIPVLESLTCGTPVVASSRSSIPEVGGDAALYADPENPREIAEKMAKLIMDVDLRDELFCKATIQAAKFEPKKIASDLLKLF